MRANVGPLSTLITIRVSRMDTLETVSRSLFQYVPIAGEIDAGKARKHLQHCDGGIHYSLAQIITAT